MRFRVPAFAGALLFLPAGEPPARHSSIRGKASTRRVPGHGRLVTVKELTDSLVKPVPPPRPVGL